MATQNFFALLGDDENDDPSDLLALAGSASLRASAPDKQPPALGTTKQQQQQQHPPPKLPSKPLPPAVAVREAEAGGARGRGIRGGGGARGNYGNRGRGFDGGFNRPSREGGFQGDRTGHIDRNFNNNYRNGGDFQGRNEGYAGGGSLLDGDSVPRVGEDGDGGRHDEGSRARGRGRVRGRGRGFGFMADGEEPPRRRDFDRKSGTGRGNEMKREGAGRGNWGVEIDQGSTQETVELSIAQEEKPAVSISEAAGIVPEDTGKKTEEEPQPESAEADKKEDVPEEDNEMTLDEYEKLLAEKRRGLEALKAEERKVTVDKDFESMQLVDRKYEDDGAFLQMGLDKGKRKEILDKEERAKKSVSINEFLRPAEGEEYYASNGRRGRGGRGRGDRGVARGGFGGGYNYSRQGLIAPRIEDPGQFPTLGGR